MELGEGLCDSVDGFSEIALALSAVSRELSAAVLHILQQLARGHESWDWEQVRA